VSTPIRTARLDLVAATTEALRIELEEPARLGPWLGARVPTGWPPDFYDDDAVRFTLKRMKEHPGEADWGFHYFLLRSDDGVPPAILVGCGGFKGAPGADGTVEVGYSVVKQYRRRGIASEAVRGFLGHAFSDPRVTRVIAETYPYLTPSIGVLEKCGFNCTGTGSEPGIIRYELLREAAYESA
jgi:ribosomal-protein-alanine N-acetyltransferase